MIKVNVMSGSIVHTCYSLNGYNAITALRMKNNRLLVRGVAELCYAALILAGVVECVVKSIFSLMAIQYNSDLGYLMSNDAAFSFQVALCSFANLAKNLFSDSINPLPKVVYRRY